MDNQLYPEQVEQVTQAAEAIKKGNHIFALTGAGISTESGLPDYRGKMGSRSNPEEAKKITDQLLEKVRKTFKYPKDAMNHPQAKMLFGYDYLLVIEPNRAHRALVVLEKLGKLHFLATQNVDNLHVRSGFPPSKLAELHGNCFKFVCKACNIYYNAFPIRKKVFEDITYSPQCESCGRILSSHIVNFGDLLPEKEIQQAMSMASQSDVFLGLGSTLAVYPSAGLVTEVKNNGGTVIIINMGHTAKDSEADILIHGRLSVILSALVERVNQLY